MQFSLLRLVFVVVFFSRSQAFCGDRKLDGDLSRASVRAGEWLREQMGAQGTLPIGHSSAWAFHSLRLVGYSVPKISNLGAEHLKQEIQKIGLDSVAGGRLALYILGVISACEDPRNFNDQDLVVALKGKMSNYGTVSGWNHPFQLGLALLALCTSGESVEQRHIIQLIDKLKPQMAGSAHSIDTLSMGTLALSCIRREQKGDRKLKRFIKSAANHLRSIQKNKNGKFGNEATTSLAVQALLAAGVRWKKWDCKTVMADLLSMQDNHGAFTNVLGTIHALPALIGALPYDVKDLACPKDGNGGEAQEIRVCMRIEFQQNLTDKVPPKAECFNIKNGTNAHEVMKMARELHPCYNFTVKLTSYGHSVTSLCGVARDPPNKLYWSILIDPGRKPAPYGIDSLKPRDGQTLVFYYKKFSWK